MSDSRVIDVAIYAAYTCSAFYRGDFYIAVISPAFGPRVTHDLVILTVLGTVPYGDDGMVNAIGQLSVSETIPEE